MSLRGFRGFLFHLLPFPGILLGQGPSWYSLKRHISPDIGKKWWQIYSLRLYFDEGFCLWLWCFHTVFTPFASGIKYPLVDMNTCRIFYQDFLKAIQGIWKLYWLSRHLFRASWSWWTWRCYTSFIFPRDGSMKFIGSLWHMCNWLSPWSGNRYGHLFALIVQMVSGYLYGTMGFSCPLSGDGLFMKSDSPYYSWEPW